MKAMPEVIKIVARNLRKNMTLAEKELWNHIRRGQVLGRHFQKQKPIFVYEENSGLPRYIIADFYCSEKKLVIELDGSIHDNPEILLLDKHKEELLQKIGYKIIRFTNTEVLRNIDEVMHRITKELE